MMEKDISGGLQGAGLLQHLQHQGFKDADRDSLGGVNGGDFARLMESVLSSGSGSDGGGISGAEAVGHDRRQWDVLDLEGAGDLSQAEQGLLVPSLSNAGKAKGSKLTPATMSGLLRVQEEAVTGLHSSLV